MPVPYNQIIILFKEIFMRKGLLFIFALLSAAAFAVEWEDETVIGINKVDPFATHFSYATAEAATNII